MTAAGSLGNNTKSRNPSPAPALKNSTRFALQDAAREILGGRLNHCCRSIATHRKVDTPARTSKVVQVVQHTSGALSYGNLVKCGSVWVCPVCSARIVVKRRQDLSDMIDAVYAKGFVVTMLTLTVPHQRDDELKDTLAKLSRAKRLMQNRKPWKSLASDLGLVGDVRTLEVTHGGNGWHPHFHCLLVHCKNSRTIADLTQSILRMWQDACFTAGLSRPNEHGVSLVRCESRHSKRLGDYIAKFGMDFEMTMGAHSKVGAGRSPFRLLADSMNGDSYAAKLFLIYATAFHGKRQLVYSRGLRDLLGLGADLTDEQIMEDGKDAKLVYIINWVDWRKMCRFKLRGSFLDYLSVVLSDPSGSTGQLDKLFPPG